MIFIVPVAMLICGAWLRFYPPKTRNRWTGYRTKRSLKSQEAWDFAQRYCGKIWLMAGLIMLVVSALAAIFIKSPKEDNNVSVCGSILQTIVLCLSCLPVEKALKNKE